MMSWADMCSDSGAETSGETPARVGERHLPSDTDEASPHAHSPSHRSCESQNQGNRLTQVREIFDQAQRLLQAVCSAVDQPGAVPGGGIGAVRDQAELLLLLDSVRLVEMTAKDRALWSCIRGRALDVVSSTHNPEAERELSRAVKLDPELGEAWNQLGTSAWKRGDEQFAHDCWQCTLRYCNALDGRADAVKVAMRELSMAFRVKGENPDESLRLAKDLVSRDMADGKSWLNLGNAYMATFFTSAFDQGDLHRALRAYSRAEACGAGADPDLHFNKASVHRYLEEYPQAAAELQYAGELDPTLPVASALRDMRQLVREMAKMVSSRCSLSPARLRTVLDKALPPDRDPSLDALAGRGPAPLASLREGVNTALAVTCLVMATPKTDVPIRFVVSDRDGTFAAVSVFNMLEGKVKPGDVITVLSPFKRTCSLAPLPAASGTEAEAAAPKSEEGREQDASKDREIYQCLQVGAGSLLHNGMPLDTSYLQRASAVFTVAPAAVGLQHLSEPTR